MKWLLLGGSTGLAAAAAAAYGLMARPWHLRWGATREELTRALPFDGLIREPNYFATRAITVDAPPEDVWWHVVDPLHLPAGTAIRHKDQPRCVVFAPPEIEAEATWVVVLEPLPDGKTRVLSRNRARFAHRASAVMRYLLVDPGQFLFERDWLLRIRRAGADLRTRAIDTAAPAPTDTRAARDPVPQSPPASPDASPAARAVP